MGGGLMQLVAYGAQDIYLTGNPQITFFKVVYRRHTNFSMECIQQTINGTSTLTTSETTGSVTISRNGDLVSDVYVATSTDGVANGDRIVSSVELEIGGQRIDKQTREWMQVWEELTTPASKAKGLKAMKSCDKLVDDSGGRLLMLPLQFWFCRNPGLALPLIALQYHEVKLKFVFGKSTEVGLSSGKSAAIEVWADYIYLDTDERRRFAQVSHEYLIEQVQYQSYTNTSGDHKLNFNHPVKELIWTSHPSNVYDSAKLILNGHDRFSVQEEEYFQLRQPIKYHTSVPNTNISHATPARHGTEGTHLGSITAAPFAFNGKTYTDVAIVGTGGNVIVSKGGNGTYNLSGASPAAISTEAVGASAIIYSFHTDDLLNNGHSDGDPTIPDHPKINDVFEVKVGGLSSAANAATAETDTVTRFVKVTGVAHGALGSFVETSHTHVQFNVSLLQGTLGAEITGSAQFKIFSMKLISSSVANTSKLSKRINVYSFALKPEEHQPSGTCNFSRIDTAKLNFTSAPGETGNIYAVNYNVLRIMSGMGGLAYSN